MRLYTIEESLTEAEVRNIVDSMPDWFKIEAYEFNSSLICTSVCVNGKSIAYAIMDEQQIVKSLELVGHIGMSIKITDITQNAIDGKLDQEILNDCYIMENIINKYILENVDKNTILDKINKYGMESLSKIDYILLDA